MGGDDLGSDDEYLVGNTAGNNYNSDDDYGLEGERPPALKASTAAVVEDDDDDNDGQETRFSRKRKQGEQPVAGNEEPTTSSSTKKKKKNKKSKTPQSRSGVLLEAGRSIEQESVNQQASFLWTALMHHHQIQSGKGNNSTNDENSDGVDVKLQPILLPSHFIAAKTQQSTSSFEARLRECIPSMKQLKTWKHKQSPMILIVCLSARRAVQVLKELKPLKTRIVKLFAKHLTVAQQETWLQESSFGIAVGTPHRLQVLAASGALQLTHTKVVVLDAHKDSKNFTVCTLADTAPHCMEFLRDQVLPALSKRPENKDGLKIAFC